MSSAADNPPYPRPQSIKGAQLEFVGDLCASCQQHAHSPASLARPVVERTWSRVHRLRQ